MGEALFGGSNVSDTSTHSPTVVDLTVVSVDRSQGIGQL